jgi:hypothetical protein
MLRFLYRAALHAHPPYFRKRFAEEMLAIFDQTESGLERTGLLADAGISLVRQWTLRPRFWEEPATAADGGVVLFSSLGDSKPRMAALLSGAVLSAMVLNGVSLTMGYAWEHPRFLEFRRPTIVPPASWTPPSKEVPATSTYAAPYLSTDQGRVLLIFNAHDKSTSKAPSGEGADVPVAEIAPPASDAGIGVPASMLSSYAGIYLSHDPSVQQVRVGTHGDRLELDVVGQFRSPLAPVPNSQLLACEVGDCWVAFLLGEKGTVDRIEVHHLGRQIVAVRTQSGMVF